MSTLWRPGMGSVTRPSSLPRATAVKLELERVEAKVDRAEGRERGEAVGDVALVDEGKERLHVRVIDAQDREPVERHLVDEVEEGRLKRLERAVVIEVLGVDVGDHRDGGRELHERAVGLVGFGHEILALTQPGVRSERRAACRRSPRSDRGRAWRSTVATSEVVVVLPCEPAMAMPYFRRISSASISARGITGICRAHAPRRPPGWGLHRGRDDHDVASPRCCRVMPVLDRRRRATTRRRVVSDSFSRCRETR